MFKALVYAYVLGGLTFIPLCLLTFFLVAVYTSVPVGDPDHVKKRHGELEQKAPGVDKAEDLEEPADLFPSLETKDLPKTRKGWLTIRHAFEESPGDGGYVNLVRAFLDSRSKDPKKSRPKDMWYVVLKGKVLYLYEDEDMTDCNAVVELGSHDVVVYPEGQLDGELFAKRNAICLRPKDTSVSAATLKEKSSGDGVLESIFGSPNNNGGQREKEKAESVESEKRQGVVKDEGPNTSNSWFIFVRSNVEMEDWYLALLHASEYPAQTPTLPPLQAVFQPADMDFLISTLDEQPDVIPMRWLNALVGRLFFSYYRTHTLESNIIARLMKKLSKVKRPAFLTDVVVTEVSVGNKPPMFSKPMLKELTKEGDASVEIHLQYKGEIRITIEATAIINLGQFKSYNVKLVLAAVVKELEGNLLIKVKRPPSNRIWYAFTQNPKMVLQVEPIVSDRQLKWGMILSTIESKLREIIQESVVMPNMDDIAYFESSPYKYRGGIWSDASRLKERRPRSPTLASGGSQTTSPPLTTASEPSLPADPYPVGVTRHENDEIVSNLVAPIGPGKGIPVKEQAEPTVFPERSQSEPFLPDEQRGRSPKVHPVTQASTNNLMPEIYEPSDDSLDAFTLGLHSSQSRKSSAHSVRSHKSAKSSETTPETPVRPRKTSDASREPSSNSSPSSFLSTLRSKTSDKQAFGNSARETMRKWGVNWSNLKKEFNSEENGDLTPKLRGKIEVTSKRSSYAEVRAAVSERRERERSSQTDEESKSSRSVSPAPVTELPCKETVEGAASGSVSQTSGKSFAVPFLTAGKSSPSPAKTDVDVASDISEDDARPIPIQAQPQAKTMTIPGIHASHKGEVMSMGYVAPRPNLAPNATKPRNPAMQSVYRLWRSPAGNGHESDILASVKQTDTLPGMPEGHAGQLESSPAVEAMPPPPPLPPRPDFEHTLRSDDRDGPAVDLIEAGREAAASDDGVVLLSGEAVLDSLSIPTATMTTPPPLPPRRISSSA